MSIEAKNPGLNIAFWDQPGDLLTLHIHRLFSAVVQCLVELLQSLSNSICVCIDHHDQLGSRMPATIYAYFLAKCFPYPILSASPPRCRAINLYLMFLYPASLEVSDDQHFMMAIF